ncbi:Uncharacterized protein dnl_45150 [Desulfonema limicola]|uniref:Uncharacterized protein n=1 Tax=Desulfonema limicola TaxID=45656 RepID=A0A975BB25_9BACT|nr:Uncharacterized protein dnl_45150 [Desulfonema limicola]
MKEKAKNISLSNTNLCYKGGGVMKGTRHKDNPRKSGLNNLAKFGQKCCKKQKRA